jgi:cysteine desulfuration protein SufE
VPIPLDELVAELKDADRQERIEILIDLSKTLPALPERLAALKDSSHRVEECQSPVFMFVEREGDKIQIFADAPIEAPTVRGFVSLLVHGLTNATAEEILAVPNNLVELAGMGEILGMLRVHGLGGVLRRLKREVARVSAEQSTSTAH